VERGWNWANDENFVGNEEVSLGGSSSDTVPYVPMLFSRQPTPRQSSWHPSNRAPMGLSLNGVYLVLQPLYTRTEELELEEGLR